MRLTDGQIGYSRSQVNNALITQKVGIITSTSGMMKAVAIRNGANIRIMGTFYNTASIGSGSKFGNIPSEFIPTTNKTGQAYVDISHSTAVTFHIYNDGTMDYVSGAIRAFLDFCIDYTI